MFGATCMLLCGFLALHFRAADRGCPSAPGLPCALFTERGNGREQNSGLRCRENADPRSFSEGEMVLPDRIELSTSPLPMECSTTELRQQCWNKNRPPQGPTKRADICHRPPRCASLQGRPKRENRGDIGDITAIFARNARLSVDFGSIPRPTGQLAAGADSTHFGFRTIGTAGPLELPQSLGMLSRTAVLDP